jgi:hypothetical protein
MVSYEVRKPGGQLCSSAYPNHIVINYSVEPYNCGNYYGGLVVNVV